MNLVPLSQVCRIVNGGTPKSGVADYWGGNVAWVTPAEMGKLNGPEIKVTARTITTAGLKNSSAKEVPVGAVIMSTRAPIGHLAIPLAPMAFNQGCRGLVPNDTLDTKYLYYFLWFSREALDDLGTGTTFKELSSGSLGAYKVPLLPLAEQRRIVAVLDEAFVDIATVTANVEKNLVNARELFESTSEKIFADLEEEGVPLAALGDLTDVNSPITYGVVKPGPEGSVPFVRGGDLVDGDVRLDQLRTISKAFSDQYRRTLLRGNELLICLVGTPGECAIAPPELAGANIARQVGLIRLNDEISPEFVRDFLLSGLGQKLLGLRTGGSVQQVINLGDLKLIEVPVPLLACQLAIVSQLNTLKDSVKYLERLFEQKRIALAEFKSALLTRAFAGQLVQPERELVPA
ncbi:MAG TPA: restriction endonuclease subunit S [Sphingomicrobium sp.]|nr:restriction endonuclease subunit S [Sphingomicrobium sp.]